MTSVFLLDEELILLDGQVRAEVQLKVDAAKSRIATKNEFADLDAKLAGFIADVVTEAIDNGYLRFQRKEIRSCRMCGGNAGYAKYKSGPNKGLDNWNKPLYLQGVELADRFVSVQGHATVGCCQSCFGKVKPYLKEKLADLPVEMSPGLLGQLELTAKWKKWSEAKCTKCGWKGDEGQMRLVRGIHGEFYSGGCPQCEAENKPFGDRLVKMTKDHVVLPLLAPTILEAT